SMITRPVVPTLATAPTKNQLLGQFLAASSERRANWPQGSTVVRIEGFAGDGFQQVAQRAIHPVPGKERRRICTLETLPWPVAVPTAPATPWMAHGFPAQLAPVFRYRHVFLSSDGAGSPRTTASARRSHASSGGAMFVQQEKESTQSRGENGPCNPSSTPASYALTHSGDAISVALSRLSPAERHWSNLRRSVKSHRLCILSFLTVTFLHVRDPSMRSADRTRGGIAEICLSYEAT